MKKAGRATQKKCTQSSNSKQQKISSYFSKGISKDPLKSSVYASPDYKRDADSVVSSPNGNLYIKRKIKESSDLNILTQSPSKSRKTRLKSDAKETSQITVDRNDKIKCNISLKSTDETLESLEKKSMYDSKLNIDVKGSEIQKNGTFVKQTDTELSSSFSDVDAEQSDTEILHALKQDDVHFEKENVKTEKCSATMSKAEKNSSFSPSNKDNIKRKHLSPLKTESQNLKDLLQEDVDILNEIITSDNKVSVLGKESSKKLSDNRRKVVRNVFTAFEFDENDDDLLSSLVTKHIEEHECLGVSSPEKCVKGIEKCGNDIDSNVTDKASIGASVKQCDSKNKLINVNKKLQETSVTTSESQICELNDELNEFFSHNWHEDERNEIDLSSLQRCKIIDVNIDQRDMIVTVKEANSEATASVTCTGYWRNIKVSIGQIITILAKRNLNNWIIDNNNGYIVTDPDTLVSGTSVVGALFCMRRGVLNEKFKGIDCLANCESDASFMTIGSIVHELLQKVLKNKIYVISDISKLFDEILQSWHVIYMLYSTGMSLNDCKKRVAPYIPKIFEFVECYIKDKKPPRSDKNFKGKIEAVQDIEENIWLPKLGIKGKIDATVKVNINSKQRIMPLELKTGQSSFSIEHRGQVILYTMMMTQTGRDVDTGLLLYLKDNIMQEIKSNHSEQRDLILLRNTLAYYLTKKSLCSVETDSLLASQKSPKLMELPEPINHHSACSKCPYNYLCCAHLSKDKSIQLSKSHPLTVISNEILSGLKSEHIDYVIKWISLLEMEDAAQTDSVSLKNIWTVAPQRREKEGKCICNLKATGKIVEECGKYPHTFVRANKSDAHIRDFTHSGFIEQDFIIVSTGTRINVSTGFVIHISKETIVVLLDRDVTKHNLNAVFHIDNYSSSSLLSYSLANIGGLLNNNTICEKLRNIIIDRMPATFASKLTDSIVVNSADILGRLNEHQQRAVLKVLTANEYVLIKGMPGTGKTKTLVALVELLVRIGKSVLITAHTHSAVDNVLLKLIQQKVDFLRLGSATKIHPLLKHKSEKVLTENCDSPKSLDAVYNSKNVVGVTCFGANHAILGKRTFDVCVVDESTQILQSTVLRPLYSASKFVLVGDPKQLPPLVKSKEARKLGMDESLFVRLDTENNTVTLISQYRMNSRIMSVANSLTYGGKLKAGNEAVANATLNVQDASILESCEEWVKEVLSLELDNSVIMLNTGQTYNLKSKSNVSNNVEEEQGCSNLWEAVIILRLIISLCKAGVFSESIGVIAPYRAQVNLLREVIKRNIEINTVDQYQGRDKCVILYSCTRSSPESDKAKEHEILEDQQRLTVAITRSKNKLVIVGDRNSLERYSTFKRLFSFVREKDIVNLMEGHRDFSWEKLLELI